jgi:hypothetical protein
VVEPDPDAAADDPSEGDNTVGADDVGTLSGSDPTLPWLLVVDWLPVVWPLGSNAVWARAVVMPATTIAIINVRCIPLSYAECRRPRRKTTPDPQKMKMNFGKGAAGDRIPLRRGSQLRVNSETASSEHWLR